MLRSGRPGERDRLLRGSVAAKGQHQASWRSMRVCSADHHVSRATKLDGRIGRSRQEHAYLDNVNPSVADHLDAVETNSERGVLLSPLGDVATETARKMFFALTMLLQGPLLLLLKKVERGNGFRGLEIPGGTI